MGDEAFMAGSREVELDRVGSQPVWIEGKRAKLGVLILTNDRILFIEGSFGAGGAGLTDALIVSVVSAAGEKLAEPTAKAQEVVVLVHVRGGHVAPRRLLADLYEFTLADGSTRRIGKRLAERWESTIRRLLAERHQRSLMSEGNHGWRVE